MISVLFIFLVYSVIPTLLIRSSGWRITKKIKGNEVALTFDDGPNSTYTEQLLDVLKKYGVKATFFVVGSKVTNNKPIIKRMHEEGHTIGIHHYRHVSSWFLTPFQLKKQLRLTELSIQECINERVTLYRPPWGHFNIFTLAISQRYKIIMWSNIFGDWKIKKCKNTLLDELRLTEEGSILLLHDCGETIGADEDAPRFMIEKLEIYLRESIDKGIHFVNWKEL